MAEDVKVKIRLVDKVTKPLKSLAGGVKKSMTGMAGAVNGFAGALAIGKVVSFTKEIANMQDEMIKLGRTVGLSAKQVSGWKFAIELGGGSVSTLNTGMRSLSRGMADASRGTGEAQVAFKALGISVLDSEGNLKKVDDIMLEVSDAFSVMESGAMKNAMAQKIFGRAGTELINTLDQGSEAIKTQIDEGQKLSRVTEGSAKAAEEFNDTMLRFKTSMEGLGSGLISALDPALKRLVEFNRVTNETVPESPSTPSIILSALMTPITAKTVIGITAKPGCRDALKSIPPKSFSATPPIKIIMSTASI